MFSALQRGSPEWDFGVYEGNRFSWTFGEITKKLEGKRISNGQIGTPDVGEMMAVGLVEPGPVSWTDGKRPAIHCGNEPERAKGSKTTIMTATAPH